MPFDTTTPRTRIDAAGRCAAHGNVVAWCKESRRMPPTIRLATAQDANQIQAIYAPIVRETPISFEWEPPTPEVMRQRIEQTLLQFPWLVVEHHGDVLGYAYASRHRERASYQWSVDVSVYVHAAARRLGVGRAVYTSLFAALMVQGFSHAYAGATLPNPASVALHESLGFDRIGVYPGVGYKAGRWHDVIWWGLALQPKPATPEPPRALPLVRDTPAWQVALDAGLPDLHRLNP
jgi:phosphinothricin acetyltransferase